MFGRLTDLLNNVKNLNEGDIFIKVIGYQTVQNFIISLNTVAWLKFNKSKIR